MKKDRFSIIYVFIIFFACSKTSETELNDPAYVFDCFWQQIDRHYSFFELNQVSWDSVRIAYKKKIDSHTPNDSLFAYMDKAASLLNDGHTNVYGPQGIAGNSDYFNQFPVNQIDFIENYLVNYSVERIFCYGWVRNMNIAYVRIKTFEGTINDFIEIESILAHFDAAKGLIIDLRGNRGGRISNSELLAKYFIIEKQKMCSFRIRNGQRHSDFTNWDDLYLDPVQHKKQFLKPVILLTNRQTYSASEWFVMFMKTQARCTTIGDFTGGGSGIPIVCELPNGWLLRVSNSQTKTNLGIDFQNIGLKPDYRVDLGPNDAQKGKDGILEKAVELLQKD